MHGQQEYKLCMGKVYLTIFSDFGIPDSTAAWSMGPLRRQADQQKAQKCR